MHPRLLQQLFADSDGESSDHDHDHDHESRKQRYDTRVMQPTVHHAKLCALH